MLFAETRTILSLCDLTGTWSQPYEDAGYRVIRVDLQRDGKDVRLLELPEEPIHGVLAAPPPAPCSPPAERGGRAQRPR